MEADSYRVPFRAAELIASTRDRQPLSEAALQWLVSEHRAGEVSDAQLAAWLMAVTLNGLSDAETVALTHAMAGSGSELAWGNDGPPVADKHSTGGVGDKVSLVAVPLAAAAGLRVPKLSGAGLGFTGGTLDKLAAIPGLRTALSLAELRAQVDTIGCAIAAATAELAPADRHLYGLRDATATVGSIPLVASSVKSKKLAGGAAAIVLDVKWGSGAVMPDPDASRTLAETMVRVGHGAGRRVAAVLSSMEQPLGYAVGNALEVREAIEVLRGNGPADVRELATRLAGWLLYLAGLEPDPEAGHGTALNCLDRGEALERFGTMIAAQGGDPGVVGRAGLLPEAPVRMVARAGSSGYLAAIDARAVGLAALRLGAGRSRPGAVVDPAAGVVLHRKVGDPVAAGEALAEVHGRLPSAVERACEEVRSGVRISAEPLAAPAQLILDVVGGS